LYWARLSSCSGSTFLISIYKTVRRPFLPSFAVETALIPFSFSFLPLPNLFPILADALDNGVSSNLTSYSLTILNAASIFGRIIPNWLADTYGPLTILTPNCYISGVLIFLFIPMCKSAGGLIAFCILFGWSSGAYVSMMPGSSCFPSFLLPDKGAGLTSSSHTATTASLGPIANVGHRTAIMFLIISLAALTVRHVSPPPFSPHSPPFLTQGTPISGAIITSQNGSYVGASIFAGVTVLVGSCFNAASWWVVSREKGTRWV
jgi:hypothetical protein